MTIRERIKAFTVLGEILRASLDETTAGHGSDYTIRLKKLIDRQQEINEWFTPENVKSALTAIATELTEENLVKWTDTYPELKENEYPVTAGVIMAGNIPLAGFHDYLSVLITGNNLIAKTSSKDPELILFLSEILFSINDGFREKIKFTYGNLTGFDLIIATGSNNSSRYFEYYFGKYPNIIRKNRNSIAIIEGNESDDEIKELGKDIFLYFGLGCRNVSKIFIPKGYDFSIMAKNWEKYAGIVSHTKYANNYDFNKAVYIVNKDKFYDTGYILLKEDKRISSPVSVLYYEYYDTQHAVKQQTELISEEIQCLVGKSSIPFGKAQSPHLWDYADGIDTIEFLLKKNIAGIL